jgi:hypothetical protein
MLGGPGAREPVGTRAAVGLGAARTRTGAPTRACVAGRRVPEAPGGALPGSYIVAAKSVLRLTSERRFGAAKLDRLDTHPATTGWYLGLPLRSVYVTVTGHTESCCENPVAC